MKKIIIFCLLFLSFYIYPNSIKDKEFQFDSSLIRKYSEKNIDIDKFEKIDKTLGITHAIFAGISYVGFIAIDVIGGILLYYAFTDKDSIYYKPLQYAHIGVFIPAILSYATFVTLAFVKLGIKLKNGFSIKKPHLIAAIVSLSFYFLEIISIIVTSVFFINNYPNKEYVGLAHGIVCGATTLSMTVSFITIFL